MKYGQHILLLAEGNATIKEKMNISQGQENLFILATKGNIVIEKAVGEEASARTSTDLDGIYSSQKNIIIEGNGDAASDSDPNEDLQLIVGGSLIANALNPFQGTASGGKIDVRRSLCSKNADFPILKVVNRFDFLTQLSDFYKTRTRRLQEIAP